jgi:hypothetical protein
MLKAIKMAHMNILPSKMLKMAKIDDSSLTIYTGPPMQMVKANMTVYVLLAGVLFGAGCVSRSAAPAPVPVRIVCEEGVTTAEVMQAAEKVLMEMQFSIEKLDVEQGIIRTRPLRGAQFFEFWRSDNANAFACAEANLQTIRRSVQLRVRTKDGGPRTEDGGQKTEDGGRRTESGEDAGLCIECDVSVQRLSLPANEVAGVSQAYRMHSRSSRTLQRLEVTAQQQQAMAWIDLGPDPDLAARILDRVEQRLGRLD